VFTVSSPSLPALSHEQPTVTRVFIPACGPAFVRSDDWGACPFGLASCKDGVFFASSH
jgi:hypothetical protein